MTIMRRVALAGFACAALCGCTAPGSRPVQDLITVARPITAPITLPARIDTNRLFVDVTFRRPDGTARPASVWVNPGMGGISMTSALHQELGRDRAVTIVLGHAEVAVAQAAILPEDDDAFAQQLGPMRIDATLPAGVLRHFRITLDYQAATLTLQPSSGGAAVGAPIALSINPATGIASVETRADSRAVPLVLDPGAGYTWWRGDVVRELRAAHPDWHRVEGALGQSNQAMLDLSFEQQAEVIRLPSLGIGGQVAVHDVGVLGSGPAHGIAGPAMAALFWQSWGKGAAQPVDGWLGGNALRGFRLTIDYPRAMSWWEPVAAPPPSDLDSAAVSLVHTASGYTIGGLPRVAGAAPPEGVLVGDVLAAIDGQAAASMSRGAVIAGLHGVPGAKRRLTLQRADRVFDVDVAVVSPEPR